MTTQQPERLLKISEVMDRTSLSRAHIYTLMSRGDFPAQRKLGHRCVRWVESEVDAWTRRVAT
ncbi:AlpA family phage regulatory protein [Novosphingobium guangzhouense]|uniref:helix-turn-helix transcriptional regulator n=1 Tax=Novosphingobium guangzhouense TaxID=1850347 RepID=UPI000CCC486E